MSLFDDPISLRHPLPHIDWTPTRAAGLARLAAFGPAAGPAYARLRNFDFGPDDRSNVSALSPWLRHRLITEQEVITAVLRQHGAKAAEKFLQEVFWRGYWKGWLEMRPGVLEAYESERDALREHWSAGQPGKALQRAQAGQTGIACLDAWAQELTQLGWLHNHARMWFASIWIFTLRLPWQLGADFFARHLLDFDPASNTLPWRWVAGLHTLGKHYLARADNIAQFTRGRFDPVGQLDERAQPLQESAPLPPAGALPNPGMVQAGAGQAGKIGLLLTLEDLHPESWAIPAQVAGCGVLAPESAQELAGPQARFQSGALEDAAGRARVHFRSDATYLTRAQVLAWAKGLGVQQIVTAYAPLGAVARQLNQLERDLAGHGIGLVRLMRGYDQQVWPHAKAGFFKLKEKIPLLLAALR